ncbi:MAG: hypothetical protein Q9201_000770 [Fulgogasparrea decipioides]
MGADRVRYIDDRYIERLTSSRYVRPNNGSKSTRDASRPDEAKQKVPGPIGPSTDKRLTGDNLSNRRVRFEQSSFPVHHRSSNSVQDKVNHPVGYTTTRNLPERLKISKSKDAVSPAKRIEELTREVGCLRQELAHYKETQAVLTDFLQSIKKFRNGLQSCLDDTSRDLSIAEQPLREYWGLDSGGKDDVEYIF